MERLTFIEKLQIILNSIFASDLLLVIVGFMILAIGTFYINKHLQNKVINLLLLGSLGLYIAAIVTLIFPKLFQVIEVATQELLKQYYFPNMVILILIYAISCFIGVRSFFHLKKEKVLSIINIGFFILINLLYVTLMFRVVDTKVNIQMGMLLYQDEGLLAILEMITFVFMLFVVVNVLVFVASFLAQKIETIKKDKLGAGINF